jgi:hypothetical protein
VKEIAPVTVRDVITNPAYQRLERAKNALDAAANKLRQHRLANTNCGFVKPGVDPERFRRDEEIFGCDFNEAKSELNSALIAYAADIRSRNGHSGLQQQGTLFNGVRR